MARIVSRLVLTATILISYPARADWPCFLGPNHDSTSDETGFKKEWTAAPKKVWERKLGPAFSSFAAVGDRIYTCGEEDGQQVLYCLNAETGDVVWKKSFEKEYHEEHGNGTRATPTVDSGRVYVLGALGRLICVEADTGKDVWEKQFSSKPTWAYSGSILIEGDMAIASAGWKEGSLVAYNKKTGEEFWKAGEDPVGYATPFPFSYSNIRFIVGFLANSAIVVRASDGFVMWKIPWQTDWDVNAASPLVHDDYLMLASGYSTGASLLQFGTVDGKLGYKPVWKSDVLLAKFQSPIYLDGKILASDQNALKCVDFLTGKELWKKPRVRNGTLLVADGHLILLTEDGKLQIAKPSGEDFKPITDVQILDGKCWAQPVLHRGRLYARNLERMICLNLRD